MRPRPAFTVFELLLVLLVFGIVFTLTVLYKPETPVARVENQARRFAQELRTAHAEAINRGGIVWIELEPATEGKGADRYRTQLEVDGQEVEPAPWIELEKGVRFSPGSVTRGPLGDVARALEEPVTIICEASGACQLDGTTVMTFYFSHPQRPEIVRAVSISQLGGVRSYRWNATESQWR